MTVDGDQVYLGSMLVNTHYYGIVQDFDTPSAMTATMEQVGNDAVVVVDALKGEQGEAGKDAPLVKLQWPALASPDDLPDLTNSDEDKGKAWWIGTYVYVWDGAAYHAVQPAPQGAPGPVPHVTPTVESISWADQQAGESSSIQVGGTAADPTWHFRIAAPRGERGENGYISDAGDFEGTPGDGEVVTWDADASKWRPQAPNPLATKMYTVPQNSFQNVPLAVGTKVAIGVFELEPQEHDFNLWIMGHLRCNGADGDFDPFQIGCEVRVGMPNADLKGGTLVARGFGNSSQWMTIVPHASTSTTPTDAISPSGVYGRFAKNSAYRIGVYMFTDGLLGVYNFQRDDAQLAVQVIPIYEAPSS